jgi:DNA-binding MarR family transcriptional regulator
VVSISPQPAAGNAGASNFHAPTQSTAPARKFAKARPDLLADPDLTPSEKLLLLALALDDWKPVSERFHPSNAGLARSIGLRPRAVQKILASLEAKGRIRIEPGANPTHRVIHRVEAATDRAEAAHSSAPPPRPPVRPPHAPQCAPTRAPQCAHSIPLPSDPTPDLSQEPGRGSAPNGNGQTPTPGQATFLASLTAARREKFFSLGEGMRRQILAPHAQAFRPELLTVQGPELDRPSAKPRPDLPETLAGLLAALPGSPADWPGKAAGALAEDFGSAKDRRLWPEFRKIAHAVSAGSFPAEALVDAYRQAKAPAVEVPGAVFNLAIKRHGWGGKRPD